MINSIDKMIASWKIYTKINLPRKEVHRLFKKNFDRKLNIKIGYAKKRNGRESSLIIWDINWRPEINIKFWQNRKKKMVIWKTGW